jgi:cytochrome c oxidase cbb3-type subunit III
MLQQVLCVLGLGATALFARVSAAQAPDPAAVTPAAISAGRVIYHGTGTCVVCHGANLQGAVGPPLTAHKWKDATGGSYTAILGVVMHGVAGTAMVSHPGGISDDEARQVAAYVWAVSQSNVKP